MTLEQRITNKILRYGKKNIKDPDNLIAYEISYLVHQELEKFTHKITHSKTGTLEQQ
jgi:hypothetical protein